MNSHTAIAAPQTPDNPGVVNFLARRGSEIDHVVEDVGLENLPVVEPHQFAAHLVLVFGRARNRRGAITWPTFLGEVAPVMDEYWCGAVTAVGVVSFLKRIFTGNQGRSLREMAQLYQGCADDHLMGRLLEGSAAPRA